MKKLIILSIITYLLFTINSSAVSESLNDNALKNDKILKIGVLLPLTGKFQNIGQSFLKSIQLALSDIGNKNIKIFPKDSKGNSLDAYLSAKEFEKLGIEIVIGPVFFDSLERLNELKAITFISLTNQTQKLPKNVIAFGININSQIKILKKYFDENSIKKTLLLAPKERFTNQTKIIKNSEIKYYKTFLYDNNPNKITGEIKKITKYRERKKNLERRINILENSDLYKDKKELEKLELKHTLGEVSFDSVIVLDFGESLKSVITSFEFSDISTKNVNFFTVNQWFDETLFSESALQNLYFPSVDLKNYNKFKEKYFNVYKKKPVEVSILAYDALGLIYYCWASNKNQFKAEHLYSKDGFKGLHGEFVIINNLSDHNLKLYKIKNKKFLKVY